MMNELLDMSASELVLAYRGKDLSPVELMRAVLEQVHSLDPHINAFRVVDADGALQEAASSERRWMQGTPCGPLDGVPVSVKDMVATRGMSTQFGSCTLPQGHLTQVDAPCIELLRRAGAVIFGKTTTTEFGNKIVSDSPLTGITRNPWNLSLSAGGSSSGAGAALAARMGPLAVGTDGGGSIRVPAAWNGVCGLKPSFKRVPTLEPHNIGELSNIGPMARSVQDLALMLNAMARPWPSDWQSFGGPVEDFCRGLNRGVEGLRVAFSTTLGIIDVDPEIAAATCHAARLLEQQGACVSWLEAVEPLQGYLKSEMHSILWMARSEQLVRHTPEALRQLMDPEILALADCGRRLSAVRLMDALQARMELASAMHAFFARYDVLVCPSFHRLPPPTPGLPPDMRMAPPLTSWCNQTQQPAASVPCGLSREGLPIGLQVIGPRFHDGLVLRVCRGYERARGAFPAPPMVLSKEEST